QRGLGRQALELLLPGRPRARGAAQRFIRRPRVRIYLERPAVHRTRLGHRLLPLPQAHELGQTQLGETGRHAGSLPGGVGRGGYGRNRYARRFFAAIPVPRHPSAITAPPPHPAPSNSRTPAAGIAPPPAGPLPLPPAGPAPGFPGCALPPAGGPPRPAYSGPPGC